MVHSTVKPKAIEIDCIKNGKVDMLIHWNTIQIEREDEITGDLQSIYVYEECVFRGKNAWVLPYAMDTTEEVEVYLTNIKDELIDWGKGSKVTL